MAIVKSPLVTAHEVRAGLKRHYAQPKSGIVFEVAQSTGFAANRHIDAIAMDLWPSHGLSLHGIEIKVSRNDWRRELKSPDKAEELAKLCDFFWIAAPVGIVPIVEVPAAWGLLELRGENIVVAKMATKTDSVPIDRRFLAAIFRAASRPIDPESVDRLVAARTRELEETFDKRVKDAAERNTRLRSEGANNWSELCEALGKNPGEFWRNNDKEVIAAVKAVMSAGVTRSFDGLAVLRDHLDEASKRIGTALAGMSIGEDKR